MLKKYRNIILTNASIIGFSLNNVKAANNKQKVHLKVGNNVYWKTGDATTDIKDVNNLKELFKLISNFGETKKNGNEDANKLDFAKSEEKYFIEKVKCGNDETNKLAVDLQIDISKAKGDVEITLVPKRECIKFKYTGDKQLTKAAEDELLKKVIQGAELGSINVYDVLIGRNSKLGERLISGEDVIGKDGLKLDKNVIIPFEINQGEIDPKALKKVVCKFEPNVEKLLVAGVDLEKLCGAVNITKNGAELSAIKTALNDVQVEGSNKGIFKSDAGLSIFPDGDNGKKLVEGNVKIPDKCDFIVISGIIKDDINPIFLKKTFKVEFDNTGNEGKKVDDGLLKTIENNLNTNFGDKVVITVQQIIENIKSISNAGTIFKTSPFANLDNVTITGVNTKATDKLKNKDTVNSAEITIKIKAAEFATNVVQTIIKITCDFSSINRDLKEVFKNDVNTTLNKIKVATSVTDILNVLNTDLNGYLTGTLDNKDITINPVATDDNVNSNSSIKFTESGIAKLKDCFEAPAKPEGGNGSGSSNGDEQKGDDKKEGEKGYSGSSKKNK